MTSTFRHIVFSALPLLLLSAPMLSADPAPEGRAKAEAQDKPAAKSLENHRDHPAATARSLPLAGGGVAGETIKNSIGMSLVRIASGKFMMGSPATEEGRFDTEVQHEVTLTKGFYIGTTAVTQAQWKAVMGTDPSHFKGDDLPVETVSWDEAMAFCQRLSGKEGKHYRLPSEAEREYACRAGTNGRFGGTGDLDEMAWFGDNSGRDRIDSDNNFKTDKENYGKRLSDNGCQTHPVARKKANAWGLYDMNGNVFEWCRDWYVDYPNAAATDPQGSVNGSARVLRGGSWFIYPLYCRSAFRFRNAPDFRSYIIGFRLCLDFE